MRQMMSKSTDTDSVDKVTINKNDRVSPWELPRRNYTRWHVKMWQH